MDYCNKDSRERARTLVTSGDARLSQLALSAAAPTFSDTDDSVLIMHYFIMHQSQELTFCKKKEKKKSTVYI